MALLVLVGGTPLAFAAATAVLAARARLGRIALVAACSIVLLAFALVVVLLSATAVAPEPSLFQQQEAGSSPFTPSRGG